MDQLAQSISSNPYLEAVATIVAFGTLLLFLWRNIRPAGRFLFEAIMRGLKTAILRFSMKYARLAINDARDQRLITTTAYHFAILISVRILNLFTVVMSMVLIASLRSNGNNKSFWDVMSSFSWYYWLIVLVLSCLISATITFYLFAPLFGMSTYRSVLRKAVERKISVKP